MVVFSVSLNRKDVTTAKLESPVRIIRPSPAAGAVAADPSSPGNAAKPE
jgi:hypothetical protein